LTSLFIFIYQPGISASRCATSFNAFFIALPARYARAGNEFIP
jgi:hypothetical protein